MSLLNVGLLLLSLAGFAFGGLNLCWAKADPESVRSWLGRLSGIAGLLCLGVTGMIGASIRSPGLVPLGLLTGFLVVAMVWESPDPRWDRAGR